MKGNKIKTTLLIAVLVFSMMAGLAAMPVSAATAISAKYVFEDNDSVPGEVEVGWSTVQAVLGKYSARLELTASAAGGDYAYIRIYPDATSLTINDLLVGANIPIFDYFLDASHATDQPDIELYFTPESGDGWIEFMVYYVPGEATPTNNAWVTLDEVDPADYLSGTSFFYGEEPDGTPISGGSDPSSRNVNQIVAQIVAIDASYGDWVLTRVTPQIGWGQDDIIAYIDNVTIAGVTYDLEPQSITAGQSYNIQWATGQASKDVELLYTPENVADLSATLPTLANGDVTFYGVTTDWALNWTLSDLIDTPIPTPAMDEDGLVMLKTVDLDGGAPEHFMYTYFLVQPANDLTVTVTPSAINVDDEAVTIEVTVTNATGPVKDAYVVMEYWDGEATQINEGTAATKVVVSYTIKTLSNGKASFDIDAPEVAGTLFIMAGTDLGTTGKEDDGDYFDHWGYTTLTISSVGAVEITASPLTYTQGIEWDLNITLANSPATLDVLGTAGTTGVINITISGDDLSVTEIGPDAGEASLALKDADSKLDVIKVYIDDVDKTTEMLDANIVTALTGDEIVIQVRSDGDSKPYQIQLYGFKSAKLVDVTVSANVDIGGVTADDIDGIADDGTLDSLADYVDTGDKTISIATPSDINIQGLVPSSIDALASPTVEFTVYYVDESDDVQKADATDFFDVTVTYPTGRTYTGETDADGLFSLILDDGTAAGHSYKVDEKGTLSILVSGYHDRATLDASISGSATIPVNGYEVSTDTETLVVLEEQTITITVTNGTDTVINNAIVTLTQDAGTLTATGMASGAVKIDGTVTSISDGLYVFPNLNASQVCTIEVLVQTGVPADMARLEIKASNPVLTVTSTKDTLTNIIDNVFTIRVMDGTTPEVDATIELNVTFTAVPTDKETNSTGYSVITIDTAELPSTVDAVRIYVVSSDVAKTGELVLPVAIPVYQANATFYLTAGIDSYGNFTIKSADGDPEIILVDDGVTTGDGNVHAYAHLVIDDTGGELTALSDMEVATNGYAWFMLGKEESTTTALIKEDYLNITAEVATDSLSVLVQSIPIYNPIVSNSSYTGFPVTYTAYVGQSQNFYIKIQDASGAAVEGATVTIDISGTDPSGDTNSAGETTITWEPTATGTYDIHLNAELIIGNITVESYTAPQLAVDYTPETVYLDDIVTVSVTVDSEPEAFVSVTIVNPDGVLLERMTTIAGTSTFTADILGDWSLSVTKTDYTSASTTLEVLEREPTEIPAETTGEETLDSTGAPKTSFALGETVLASAEVTNVGTESQTMLIIVQLTDPMLRVLSPSYISVTLLPGQSLTPSIGFLMPLTGYTTGTWTAKIMVLDTWPALGGVTIGLPVTITFTVTS